MKNIPGFTNKIIAAICIIAAAASCDCSNRTQDGDAGGKNGAEADSTAAAHAAKLPEEPVFDIITDMGTIKVKLYSKTPRHRDNFIKLVEKHFYDSLLFHRVINNFMIQAGDPNTRDSTKVDSYGMTDAGYTIPAEFVNQYYHKKGALAAARRGDEANPMKESSGSQFYLVQGEEACLRLDGEYTIFGETLEGLDVIDRIAAVPTDRYDRPVKPVRILTIRPDLTETEEVMDSTMTDASNDENGERKDTILKEGMTLSGTESRTAAGKT